DNPDEPNGLFTKYVVASLPTPGLSIDEIFRKVKEDVYRASNRQQNPFTYDNMVGRYYPVSPPAPVSTDAGLQVEVAFWNSIQGLEQAGVFEDYLRRWPDGQFATVARARLAKLRTPAPAPAEAPKVVTAAKGETRVNPKDGLTYVWIPSGQFTMGCSPGDNECDKDEKPAHPVTITRGFWLGQTEVTVGAYKRFVQATGRQMPAEPSSNARMPMINVSWNDAANFCGWMGGRLPSEAEWEYAARAGSAAASYGLLEDIAWVARRNTLPANGPHEVGAKQANGFSLHDMLGNVWEWVADWYDNKYYAAGPARDPRGPEQGTDRVVRGGSWDFYPLYARVSVRSGLEPSSRGVVVGFRCAGELP
ncbi:MAG: formylglycine-generating enzyme family protein, partial [Acidobacteria bacterium]|nr:formylglycine-generating enzyme family protein [Acidobacteriota bacterium]